MRDHLTGVIDLFVQGGTEDGSGRLVHQASAESGPTSNRTKLEEQSLRG